MFCKGGNPIQDVTHARQMLYHVTIFLTPDYKGYLIIVQM
jgi:hypothetical protein